MAILARYEKTTGQIRGVWEAPNVSLLEAQIDASDALYGYILSETVAADEVQEQWQVVDGVLVAKQEMTLTATPNPFPADGQTVCTITVEPFVRCNITLNQVLYTLTEEDQTLTLQTAIPGAYTVMLTPMPGYWAQTITVEAQ